MSLENYRELSDKVNKEKSKIDKNKNGLDAKEANELSKKLMESIKAPIINQNAANITRIWDKISSDVKKVKGLELQEKPKNNKESMELIQKLINGSCVDENGSKIQVTVNGEMSNDTLAKIFIIQQSLGLKKVDGVFGPETIQSIVKKCNGESEKVVVDESMTILSDVGVPADIKAKLGELKILDTSKNTATRQTLDFSKYSGLSLIKKKDNSYIFSIDKSPEATKEISLSDKDAVNKVKEMFKPKAEARKSNAKDIIKEETIKEGLSDQKIADFRLSITGIGKLVEEMNNSTKNYILKLNNGYIMKNKDGGGSQNLTEHDMDDDAIDIKLENSVLKITHKDKIVTEYIITKTNDIKEKQNNEINEITNLEGKTFKKGDIIETKSFLGATKTGIIQSIRLEGKKYIGTVKYDNGKTEDNVNLGRSEKTDAGKFLKSIVKKEDGTDRNLVKVVKNTGEIVANGTESLIKKAADGTDKIVENIEADKEFDTNLKKFGLDIKIYKEIIKDITSNLKEIDVKYQTKYKYEFSSANKKEITNRTIKKDGENVIIIATEGAASKEKPIQHTITVNKDKSISIK